MDSLFHFLVSWLFFSDELTGKEVILPILVVSVFPDILHIPNYVLLLIRREEAISVRFPTLWYYGKILHSILLTPFLFILSSLMAKVFLFHVLLDILTHNETQDTAFYVFPIKITLPQLGIFNWGYIQMDTRKLIVHPLTYMLWAGLICGLFLKQFRV